MRYFLYYIYHYFISNSRHGTHSPFVYALADQVVYNKQYQADASVSYPDRFQVPYQLLLHRILYYLEVSSIGIGNSLDDKSVDAFWFNRVQDEDIETILNLIAAGKIVVMDKPYSKYQFKAWKDLISDQRVTVSINLFHFGILLKRDAQHKEDFLLRQS